MALCRRNFSFQGWPPCWGKSDDQVECQHLGTKLHCLHDWIQIMSLADEEQCLGHEPLCNTLHLGREPWYGLRRPSCQCGENRKCKSRSCERGSAILWYQLLRRLQVLHQVNGLLPTMKRRDTFPKEALLQLLAGIRHLRRRCRSLCELVLLGCSCRGFRRSLYLQSSLGYCLTLGTRQRSDYSLDCKRHIRRHQLLSLIVWSRM